MLVHSESWISYVYLSHLLEFWGFCQIIGNSYVNES